MHKVYKTNRKSLGWICNSLTCYFHICLDEQEFKQAQEYREFFESSIIILAYKTDRKVPLLNGELFFPNGYVGRPHIGLTNVNLYHA